MDICATRHKSCCGLVDGLEMIASNTTKAFEKIENFIAFIVDMAKLGVFKKGIKNTEIGVTKGFGLFREIQQIANHYIDQNPQVVSVEVLVCCTGCEQQIQEFEY